MNDRLGDLGGLVDDDDADEEFENEDDIEAQNKPQTISYMDHFFQLVDQVKEDINRISKATSKIGDINEDALQATTTEKENELSNKLRPLIDETNNRAKKTKNMLGLLKEETKKLETEGKLNSSDLRVRDNLCNTLTRKFIDEMKAYQNAQQKYKTDIKKKVARQVQIVKPDATDEDIDAVMRSEGGRDALYREQILAGGVNDQIKTTYAKVAGKYQDVLTLESSVAELHQMFLDFALLTEQQGELLDQIEFQVKQAGDYIEDANVDVYESIQYQSSIRKKQCWIMAIVIVCVVILLFSMGIIP